MQQQDSDLKQMIKQLILLWLFLITIANYHMKKIILATIFLIFWVNNSFAATATATASGNWTATAGVWSGGAGTGGSPALGDVIIINSGVTVTVNSDLSASVYTGTLTIIGSGSLVITSTGKMSRTTGNLTFSGSGAGSFLIAGTYITSATGIPTFSNTSAKLQIQNGGILSSTASGNGGSIFGTTPSTNVIWDEGSIFELNGGNNNWNNTTFFPNNTTSTTTWPILRLTSVGTLNSGVTGITINGILHVNSSNAASAVNTAAIKMTIRGGVQADFAIVTSNATLYTLTITGANAILSGNGGISTASNGGGVVIASGASVTVTGNTSIGTDTIYGTLSINNGVTLSVSQTSTLNGSSWVLSNNGSLNFNNLRIAATPTTQPSTNFSIGGSLTVLSGQNLSPTAGTITFNASTSAISNSGTLRFNNLTIASTPTAQSQYNSSYTVAGSLTVNNGVTFSPTSGTVTISGATITNNSTTAIGFSNLIINSTGTALTGSATVSGTLTLTNGILTTSNANPSLLTVTGSISGGTTNTNYINGTLTRTLTNAVSSVFPVGNAGASLPFTIVPNGTPTITVSATNADAGATATYDAVYLSTISHTEYWTVTLNSGTLNAATASAARQTTLSGLNTLAQSVAQNGSYTNAGGTVSGNGINLANIGTGLGFFTFATLNLAPSILSFSSSIPASSTTGYQGSMVTLTGYNFTGATSVAFGGKAADSFAVISNTSIRAYVSNGNSGHISVTTNNGSAQSSTSFTYLGNNPNFLVNSGFETLTTGTSIFYAGNGTINNTLAWQWQTSFVAGSSSGTSVIVDTVKYSGNKSLQLTINSHTNRNDIKLIQVIDNVAAPPAGKYLLSFYLKSARNGDSVTANIFKSTTASNSNGVVGDKNQPAQLFIATKEWQRCKMYVDLTGWTIAERTNMRVSIRPNTSNLTPSGPYPKTYWFDDFTFSKYDTLTELKEVAILVAENRRKVALDSGFTNEVASLDTAIINLKNRTLSYPVTPTRAIGFYPPLLVTDTTNPYIKQMNVWAATYLNSSFTTFPKATVGNMVFGSPFDARELGTETEYLVWLLTSPYSNYRYDPELFRRFLTIVYATSDDYKINGKEASGIPGATDNSINDWFAAPKTVYTWWMAEVMFSDYMPSILIQRLRDAADSMGKYHYSHGQGIDEYVYANRDVSYAEILMQAGLYRNNSTWINQAKRMVDSIHLATLLPDGGYLYRKQQNEVTNYHGGNNNSLAKIWVVSGYQPAWDCIAKAANYEILSIESKDVGEFYTAAVWKQQWNASSGYSAEPLLAITQNKYLKTKYNELLRVNGYDNQIALSLAFYNPNIDSLPLPDDYVVYDRNIQGPRCRNGRFSYAASLRKVVTDAAEPGMQTFVGAMVTQPDANNPGDGINSVLQAVQSKVHVRNPTLTEEWTNWGYMMSKTDPKVVVARKAAAFSSPSVLQYQTSGPTGWETNWASNQHWITLDDRLFGFVETYPKNTTGTTQAEEIEGRVKFTFGRNSSYPLDAKGFVIDTPNKQYTYGKLRTVVHGHDFTSIDTVTAAVLRDFAPFNSSEIKFKFDLSNGTSLYNYPASTKKYFMIEVKHIDAVGNATVTKIGNGKLSGLSVFLNGNRYTSLRNDSTGTMTLNLSSYMIAGNVHQVHYSRNDTTRIQPITITSSTFSLPATEQILLISSSSPSDLGKGWENYDETLKNTGIFPAATTTNWTGGFNTDFTHFGNWDAGVPNDSTNAVIYNVAKQPIVTTNQSAKALRLITGATVTNNSVLSIKDTLTNRGTIAGTGTVSLTGTSNQKIIGIGTINNLTLNNPAGATISSGSNMTSLTGTLTLNNGTLTTNGNLTLKSSSTATASIAPIASGSGISGNITVERFIPAKTARKYSFISSPVSQLISNAWQQQIFITGNGIGGTVCGSANSNGFDATITNTPSMYGYNNQRINNTRWISIPNTNATQLTVGKGYRVNIRGTRTNGGGCSDQLNNGAPTAPNAVVLSASGSYTNTPSTTIYGTSSYGSSPAYTLLGNPFPAAISMAAVMNANAGITNNCWMYANANNTTSNYGSWNKATKISTGFWPSDFALDNPTDLVVPSGSAFFVERTRATDTTVVFAETHKLDQPKNGVTIFGSPTTLWNNQVRIKLALPDSSMVDEVVALWSNETGISDTGYTPFDTYSLNVGNLQYLALGKNDYPLSLLSKPIPTGADTIAIHVYSQTTGNFQLMCSGYQQMDASFDLWLVDRFLNKQQPIKSQPIYAFTVTNDSNSMGSNRFLLVARRPTPLPNHQLSLQLKYVEQTPILEWQIAPNSTFQQFQVQAANQANQFTTVSTLPYRLGQTLYQNEKGTLPYEYYRITAIQHNGEGLYSNIIRVQQPSTTAATLSPNPSRSGSDQWITMTNLKVGTYAIKVLNPLGKEIWHQEVKTNGMATEKVHIQLNQPAGNYPLMITDISSGHVVARMMVVLVE